MTLSPRRTRAIPRPLTAVGGARGFRVIVNSGNGDSFGVTLEETYGGDVAALAAHVITTPPRQTQRVVDALFTALRGSGYRPSALAFTRTKPIWLEESAGVRLALVLVATQPVTKHERVAKIVAGIDSMSPEETYYWYSKCVGVDAIRSRRALRILLSD